jgi:hypothetical protein
VLLLRNGSRSRVAAFGDPHTGAGLTGINNQLTAAKNGSSVSRHPRLSASSHTGRPTVRRVGLLLLAAYGLSRLYTVFAKLRVLILVVVAVAGLIWAVRGADPGEPLDEGPGPRPHAD